MSLQFWMVCDLVTLACCTFFAIEAIRWQGRARRAEAKSKLDRQGIETKIERDERMGQFEPPGSYGVCWVDYVPVRGQRRRKCTLAIDHAGDHGDAKMA